LFMYLTKAASVTSITLRNIVVRGPNACGGLAGENDGTVTNSSVSGALHCRNALAGGLVAVNRGTITTSQSTATVDAIVAGGLVAFNLGDLSLSFATGTVNTRDRGTAGGLVGSYGGSIENSYAEGSVTGGGKASVAGFIGDDSGTQVTKSYSTGAVSGKTNTSVGGFTCTSQGTYVDSYWDTTTSGTDQASCNGSVSGITGLTTQQLQSGLPQGFSSKIWAEDASINNGFPYLIANPPAK